MEFQPAGAYHCTGPPAKVVHYTDLIDVHTLQFLRLCNGFVIENAHRQIGHTGIPFQDNGHIYHIALEPQMIGINFHIADLYGCRRSQLVCRHQTDGALLHVQVTKGALGADDNHAVAVGAQFLRIQRDLVAQRYIRPHTERQRTQCRSCKSIIGAAIEKLHPDAVVVIGIGFDHAQILGIITGAADNAQVVSVPADTKRQHGKAAV